MKGLTQVCNVVLGHIRQVADVVYDGAALARNDKSAARRVNAKTVCVLYTKR